jgi:hypothetical protein
MSATYQFRIEWRAIETGYIGYGEWVFETEEAALSVVNFQNKANPDFEHWVGYRLNSQD